MFPQELMDLLPQVIKSWQVLAMTLALVLYMYMVNYVARSYHHPRAISRSKPRKSGAKTQPDAKKGKKEDSGSSDTDSNEELGLEES